MSRENKQENGFEKNISLWEGVLVLKGQYTQKEREQALKKDFTLGGCFGFEKPVYKAEISQFENSKFRKYCVLVLKVLVF